MQDSKKNDGKAKSSVVARPFNTEKFAHLDKDAPITREKALQISLNAIKSELPLVLPRINNAAKAIDQVNQTIAFVSGLVEAQKKKLNELEIPTLIESIKVFRERVNNVHLDEVEFVKKQIGITVKFKEEDYKGFFWYLILIMDRNDIGPAQASEDYIREIYFQYVGEEVAKREEMIEKSKRAYAASFTKAEIVIEVPENAKAEPTKKLKTVNPKPKCTRLLDAFKDPKDFEKAVEALREVDPPMIGAANNFLLGERKKYFINSWVWALKESGKVIQLSNIEWVGVLNSYFEDLSITRTAFANEGNDPDYEYYRVEMLSLIK